MMIVSGHLPLAIVRLILELGLVLVGSAQTARLLQFG